MNENEVESDKMLECNLAQSVGNKFTRMSGGIGTQP